MKISKYLRHHVVDEYASKKRPLEDDSDNSAPKKIRADLEVRLYFYWIDYDGFNSTKYRKE